MTLKFYLLVFIAVSSCSWITTEANPVYRPHHLPGARKNPFGASLPPPGCVYQNQRYAHGESVRTPEPCLNCTCRKGVLQCFLRVCPPLTTPPPNCLPTRQEGECCPSFTCDTDQSKESPPQNATRPKDSKVSSKTEAFTSVTRTPAFVELTKSQTTPYPTTIAELISSVVTSPSTTSSSWTSDEAEDNSVSTTTKPSSLDDLLTSIMEWTTTSIKKTAASSSPGVKKDDRLGPTTPSVPGFWLNTSPTYAGNSPDSILLVTSSPSMHNSLMNDDFDDDATLENTIAGGCYLNGTLFAEGSAVVSPSFCEYCYCIRGKKMCIRPRCHLPVLGCIPRYISEYACCPTSYVCQQRNVVLLNQTTTTTTTTTTTSSTPTATSDPRVACEYDGQTYRLGEAVPTKKMCHNCYCSNDGIKCQPIDCSPHMDGCTPFTPEGHCCPVEYNCKDSKSHPSLATYSVTGTKVMINTTQDPLQAKEENLHFADELLYYTENNALHSLLTTPSDGKLVEIKTEDKGAIQKPSPVFHNTPYSKYEPTLGKGEVWELTPTVVVGPWSPTLTGANPPPYFGLTQVPAKLHSRYPSQSKSTLATVPPKTQSSTTYPNPSKTTIPIYSHPIEVTFGKPISVTPPPFYYHGMTLGQIPLKNYYYRPVSTTITTAVSRPKITPTSQNKVKDSDVSSDDSGESLTLVNYHKSPIPVRENDRLISFPEANEGLRDFTNFRRRISEANPDDVILHNVGLPTRIQTTSTTPLPTNLTETVDERPLVRSDDEEDQSEEKKPSGLERILDTVLSVLDSRLQSELPSEPRKDPLLYRVAGATPIPTTTEMSTNDIGKVTESTTTTMTTLKIGDNDSSDHLYYPYKAKTETTTQSYATETATVPIQEYSVPSSTQQTQQPSTTQSSTDNPSSYTTTQPPLTTSSSTLSDMTSTTVITSNTAMEKEESLVAEESSPSWYFSIAPQKAESKTTDSDDSTENRWAIDKFFRDYAAALGQDKDHIFGQNVPAYMMTTRKGFKGAASSNIPLLEGLFESKYESNTTEAPLPSTTKKPITSYMNPVLSYNEDKKKETQEKSKEVSDDLKTTTTAPDDLGTNKEIYKTSRQSFKSVDTTSTITANTTSQPPYYLPQFPRRPTFDRIHGPSFQRRPFEEPLAPPLETIYSKIHLNAPAYRPRSDDGSDDSQSSSETSPSALFLPPEQAKFYFGGRSEPEVITAAYSLFSDWNDGGNHKTNSHEAEASKPSEYYVPVSHSMLVSQDDPVHSQEENPKVVFSAHGKVDDVSTKNVSPVVTEEHSKTDDSETAPKGQFRGSFGDNAYYYVGPGIGYISDQMPSTRSHQDEMQSASTVQQVVKLDDKKRPRQDDVDPLSLPTTKEQPKIRIIPFLAEDAIMRPGFSLNKKNSSFVPPPPKTTPPQSPPKPEEKPADNCFVDKRIYVNGEMIVKNDPCMLCRCFYGQELCQHQSCPEPPASNCVPEQLPGFCCPRYTCAEVFAEKPHTPETATKASKIPIRSSSTTEKSVTQSTASTTISTASPSPSSTASIRTTPATTTTITTTTTTSTTPAPSQSLSARRPPALPHHFLPQHLPQEFANLPDSNDRTWMILGEGPFILPQQKPPIPKPPAEKHEAAPVKPTIRPETTSPISTKLPDERRIPISKTKVKLPSKSGITTSIPAQNPEKKKVTHSSTSPAISLRPTPTPPTKSQTQNKVDFRPQGLGPLGSLLKISGCNIYGTYYVINEVIGELSGPCSQCMCTESGVQCRDVC